MTARALISREEAAALCAVSVDTFGGRRAWPAIVAGRERREGVTAEARITPLHVELDAAMRDRDAALLAIETLRTKEGS